MKNTSPAVYHPDIIVNNPKKPSKRQYCSMYYKNIVVSQKRTSKLMIRTEKIYLDTEEVLIDKKEKKYSLIQYIYDEFTDEFQDLTERQINNILFIINYSLMGRNKHELSNGKNLFVLSAQYMRKNINNRRWKEMIDPFYKCTSEKFWNGIAKGWSYSEKLEKIIKEYKINTSYIHQISLKNEIKINIEQGISDLLLIDDILLNGNICSYNDIFKPKIDITTTDELLMKKSKLIVILNNATTNKYTRSSFGRLMLESKSNLQHLNSELRNRLFTNMNLYDYDIVNCHYVLLLEWLKKEEFRYDNYHSLIKYINSRNKVLMQLSLELQLPKNKIKQILLALLNGGINNGYNSVFSGLDFEKVEEILNNDFIYKLKGEIYDIRELIYHYIFDAKIPKKQIMAAFLQKKESEIIDIIKLKYQDKIKLLMFDGFISEKIDTKEMEIYIKEQTGFSINFSEKKL